MIDAVRFPSSAETLECYRAKRKTNGSVRITSSAETLQSLASNSFDFGALLDSQLAEVRKTMKDCFDRFDKKLDHWGEQIDRMVDRFTHVAAIPAKERPFDFSPSISVDNEFGQSLKPIKEDMSEEFDVLASVSVEHTCKFNMSTTCSTKFLKDENDTSNILLVEIPDARYCITNDLLRWVFSKHGHVENINILHDSPTFKALIQYQELVDAFLALHSLQGKNIFDGCCKMGISFVSMAFDENSNKVCEKNRSKGEQVEVTGPYILNKMELQDNSLELKLPYDILTFPSAREMEDSVQDSRNSLELERCIERKANGNDVVIPMFENPVKSTTTRLEVFGSCEDVTVALFAQSADALSSKTICKFSQLGKILCSEMNLLDVELVWDEFIINGSVAEKFSITILELLKCKNTVSNTLETVENGVWFKGPDPGGTSHPLQGTMMSAEFFLHFTAQEAFLAAIFRVIGVNIECQVVWYGRSLPTNNFSIVKFSDAYFGSLLPMLAIVTSEIGLGEYLELCSSTIHISKEEVKAIDVVVIVYLLCLWKWDDSCQDREHQTYFESRRNYEGDMQVTEESLTYAELIHMKMKIKKIMYCKWLQWFTFSIENVCAETEGCLSDFEADALGKNQSFFMQIDSPMTFLVKRRFHGGACCASSAGLASEMLQLLIQNLVYRQWHSHMGAIVKRSWLHIVFLTEMVLTDEQCLVYMEGISSKLLQLLAKGIIFRYVKLQTVARAATLLFPYLGLHIVFSVVIVFESKRCIMDKEDQNSTACGFMRFSFKKKQDGQSSKNFGIIKWTCKIPNLVSMMVNAHSETANYGAEKTPKCEMLRVYMSIGVIEWITQPWIASQYMGVLILRLLAMLAQVLGLLVGPLLLTNSQSSMDRSVGEI